MAPLPALLLLALALAPLALANPAPHRPFGAREARGAIPFPLESAAFFADVEYADDGSEDQDEAGEEQIGLPEAHNSDNVGGMPSADLNKPKVTKVFVSRIQHIPRPRSTHISMDPSKPIVVPDIDPSAFGSSEESSFKSQRRSLRFSLPEVGFGQQGLRSSRQHFHGSQFVSPGQDISSQLSPVIQNIVDRHLDATVHQNLATHVQQQVQNVFHQTAQALCPNCPQQYIPSGGIRLQPFNPLGGFGHNQPFGGFPHMPNTGIFNPQPFGHNSGIMNQHTFGSITDQVHVGPPKVIKVSQSHYQVICSGDNPSCQQIPLHPQNPSPSPDLKPQSPTPEQHSPEPDHTPEPTKPSSPDDDISIPNGGSEEEEETSQQTDDGNSDVIFSNSPKPDEQTGKEVPDIDVRFGSGTNRPKHKRSVKDDVTNMMKENTFSSDFKKETEKDPVHGTASHKKMDKKNGEKTYPHEYIEVNKESVNRN